MWGIMSRLFCLDVYVKFTQTVDGLHDCCVFIEIHLYNGLKIKVHRD